MYGGFHARWYVISTHVTELYIYCTIKGVEEDKNLHKCRIRIATGDYEILAICSHPHSSHRVVFLCVNSSLYLSLCANEKLKGESGKFVM